MKIAIVGSFGMLAHDIIKTFNTGKGNELFLYDKHNCDLLHSHLPVKRIFIDSPKPDILINCSGYNSVDMAEEDKENCYMVNSGAVGRIASACNKYGTKLVHFSSDYIFDGIPNKVIHPSGDIEYSIYNEKSETNPISVYGKSKLLGEEAAMKSDKHIIIRTAWLFGSNRSNFVDIILNKLKKGEPFKVVNDQFGSPTYTADLAQVVLKLVDMKFNGLINVTNTNDENITWYAFAKKIAEIAGYDPLIISPCSSDEYTSKAKRPQRSILSTAKLHNELGIKMRYWDVALKEYLNI